MTGRVSFVAQAVHYKTELMVQKLHISGLLELKSKLRPDKGAIVHRFQMNVLYLVCVVELNELSQVCFRNVLLTIWLQNIQPLMMRHQNAATIAVD